MRGVVWVLTIAGLVGLAEGQVAARRWSADRSGPPATSRFQPGVWAERGWTAPRPAPAVQPAQGPSGPTNVTVFVVLPGGLTAYPPGPAGGGEPGGSGPVDGAETPVFDAVKDAAIRQPVPMPDMTSFQRHGQVTPRVRRWQNLMYRTGLVYDCRRWRPVAFTGPVMPTVPSDPPEPEPTLPPEKIETVLDAMVAIGVEEVEAAEAALAELVGVHPEEARVRRLWGLTLLEIGQVERGVHQIATAYGLDPGLADDPIESLMYESRPRRLRELTVEVVRLANRRTSAEAWLTVAVLMQGEGRDTHALRMVAKAEHEGLDPVLAGLLESALKATP